MPWPVKVTSCQTIKVVIPRSGGPRALYSPAAQALLAPLGDIQIRRAACVEPTDNLSSAALRWLEEHNTGEVPADVWWVDLTAVDGPVLGPFNTRDYALKEEIEWLYEHGLPFSKTPRERLLERAQSIL